MSRTFGVATSEADIDSGTITGLSQFKTASGSTLGFFGVTAVAQRSGATQATVAFTLTTGGVGFVTTAQAQAVMDQLGEIRTLLTTYGLWAGA